MQPSSIQPITALLMRSRSPHSFGDSPTRTIDKAVKPRPGPDKGTARTTPAAVPSHDVAEQKKNEASGTAAVKDEMAKMASEPKDEGVYVQSKKKTKKMAKTSATWKPSNN